MPTCEQVRPLRRTNQEQGSLFGLLCGYHCHSVNRKSLTISCVVVIAEVTVSVVLVAVTVVTVVVFAVVFAVTAEAVFVIAVALLFVLLVIVTVVVTAVVNSHICSCYRRGICDIYSSMNSNNSICST